MGGGNPPPGLPDRKEQGLSPRGRGKPAPAPEQPAVSGSIPAWAGETCSIGRRLTAPKVYPRVGGGNIVRLFTTKIITGLSPRGRGKPAIQAGEHVGGGSIPAWAGETGRRRPRL